MKYLCGKHQYYNLFHSFSSAFIPLAGVFQYDIHYPFLTVYNDKNKIRKSQVRGLLSGLFGTAKIFISIFSLRHQCTAYLFISKKTILWYQNDSSTIQMWITLWQARSVLSKSIGSFEISQF